MLMVKRKAVKPNERCIIKEATWLSVNEINQLTNPEREKSLHPLALVPINSGLWPILFLVDMLSH